MRRPILIAWLAVAAACAESGSDEHPAEAGAVSDADDVAAPDDTGAPSDDPGAPPVDEGAPDPGSPPEDEGAPEPDTADVPVVPPQDPNICTGNTSEPLQPFGGACCFTPSSHPENPACLGYGGADEGECMNGQCETGTCEWAAWCSKPCEMGVDKLNNKTSKPGADGVTDPAHPNDCDGAEDGRFGSQYRCVNKAAPDKNANGTCMPGTTFAACDSNKDCPAGEMCDLLYIHAKYQARCVTAAKDAKPLTAPCNTDPDLGPVDACNGFSCYGVGCVGLCAGDSDCATDTCEGGKCTKDPSHACTSNAECSAWSCVVHKPYSNNAFTDEFCQPRSCSVESDCNDPDWFCRPFWNGAGTVEEVALAPACRRVPDGAAKYGEACGVSGDGTGLPPCVFATGCVDNHCGGPCNADSDCAGGTTCLLGAEWDIDVDDDGTVDTNVNVDLCQPWPHDGDLVDCATDADCPSGHHCRDRIRGTGLGKQRLWTIEYKCRKDPPNLVKFGEKCGGTTGKVCSTSQCLVPAGDTKTPAMCSEFCTSASDCPELVEFDGFTYKTVCQSRVVNAQQSIDPKDDLYVPYCWRISSKSSLEPCDDHLACPTKMYCRALAIAGNPDVPVKVEHLCADMGDGLTKLPTKDVGEPCTSGAECFGRSCLPDGAGGGYCSKLCGTDDDCQGDLDGLYCTKRVLVPRPDPANEGVTHRCVLQKTCLACAVDDDCGGGFVCANFGGASFLADMRCGATCTSNADCLEPGTSCQDDIDAKGKPLKRKVCMADSCE